MTLSPNSIARTAQAPYYAVISTSQRREGARGYGHMASRIVELARQQPGFLVVVRVRDAEGFGIAALCWSYEEAIVQWKAHLAPRPPQVGCQRGCDVNQLI